MPPSLNDRAADNWAPLFALADLAGGRWPKWARQAALAFSGDQEDESAAILLLSDLRDLFKEQDTERLSSTDIVAHLGTLEEKPWPEWGKQHKPITTRQLAALLKPFSIKPGTKRYGLETFKGYTLRQFRNVFRRYLNSSSQSVTASQVNDDAGFGGSASVTTKTDVTDSEPPKSSNGAGCDVVTDRTPPFGGNGEDPDLTSVLSGTEPAEWSVRI